MSKKQEVLKLIDAALQGYRDLLKNPPTDAEDYSRRKGEADGKQAEADEIMRGLTGSEYRDVVQVFAKANFDIEEMDAKILAPQMEDDASDPADDAEDDEPGVDDDEPEDEIDVDERAELYSSLDHDPFDGDPDDERPENQPSDED